MTSEEEKETRSKRGSESLSSQSRHVRGSACVYVCVCLCV